MRQIRQKSLQAQLRSSPVSSLGVVTDSVARLHSDPLGQRSVLLLDLAQFLLDLKGFLSLA